MTPKETMLRIDTLLSHVWMVRTFLKHSEEAEEDDELCQVYRGLYDYVLALGPPCEAGDAEAYLRQAVKKFAKFRKSVELLAEIQPEISDHTNFKMAVRSAKAVVQEVGALLERYG